MLKLTQVENRAVFFRELTTMVRAGMTLGEALEGAAERCPLPRLRSAALVGAEAARQGQLFSGVMVRFPDVFTPVEIAILRAGEETGGLEHMLDLNATYLEREYNLRQLISRETFYHKVLFSFIFLFPLLLRTLLAYFGPGGSLGAALAVFFKGLLGIAALVAVALVVFWLLRALLRQNPRLAFQWDWAKLNTPVLGPVIQRLALARWARALAIAYSAGISLPQSLLMSADLTGNATLRQPMQAAVPLLEQGRSLSGLLEQIPAMDSMALRMLKTGELTGNIDEMMVRVADHYEESALSSIRRSAALMPLVFTVIAGIIVGSMLISFYSGYFGQMLDQ